MSLIDWFARSWERWKYPEDKKKERRIEQIIKEANQKTDLPDPKKPSFIKN